MRENSDACELYTGDMEDIPGINALYNMPDKLYAIKEDLEKHLCRVTNNLFNLENRIILFDLTNFYFEGSKRGSTKAKFGHSKEKRRDCTTYVHSEITHNRSCKCSWDKVELRQCSKPTKQAQEIYKALHLKETPF